MELTSSPTASWLTDETATPPVLPPAATHATTCLNCDTLLTNRFCAHCGQPAATHRITMRHLLHDIPHSIWHVDKGIFYTLRELLLRPGPTLQGYLRGQRARHFAPLSLLLLVTGVSSFLSIKLRIGEMAAMSSNSSAELREVQAHGSESMMHYLGWIYIAISPLIGWMVCRVLRRTRINLAEGIVVALYVTAGSNLLSLLLLLPFYWAKAGSTYNWLTFGSSLLMLTYQAWAYGQLLLGTTLSRFGRWWRGLLTAIGGYLLVICAAVAIMFISNWTSFKSAMKHEVEYQRALHPRPANPHKSF